jgi:hypothetical protein
MAPSAQILQVSSVRGVVSCALMGGAAPHASPSPATKWRVQTASTQTRHARATSKRAATPIAAFAAESACWCIEQHLSVIAQPPASAALMRAARINTAPTTNRDPLSRHATKNNNPLVCSGHVALLIWLNVWSRGRELHSAAMPVPS